MKRKMPSDIEDWVRKTLEKYFDQKLSKKKLCLKPNTPSDVLCEHEFDFVSDDKAIIGEIKSSKLGNITTKKAGYTSTRKWRLIGDIFYLERVEAESKFLVLTDEELWKQFKGDIDGLTTVKVLWVSPKGVVHDS